MALIHVLQRLAALTSARETASLVVLLSALGVAILARYRVPAAFRQHRLALTSLGLGAALLLLVPRGLLPSSVSVVATGLVVLGFALHTRGDRRSEGDARTDPQMTRGLAAAWFAASAALAALFLLTDLGGYAGSLMVWEPEAMSGLVEASETDTGLREFAAQRLLWDDGVLSASHHSLLYGSGTYALWKLFGASITSLRLMAALLALGCLPAAYALGSRIGGRLVAAAAVTVLSLSPVLLYYGRYGISVTGSLLSILVLLLACERLAAADGDRWWLGPLVASAAFLATLGYSPARVATVALVTITLWYGVSHWREAPGGRRLALVLMAVVLAAVGLMQAASGTARAFVAARGEQLFTLHTKPEMLHDLVGEEVDPEHLMFRQRLVVAAALVTRTVPEMGSALSFCVWPMESAWHVIRRDAPDLPLIQGPLLLLAVWGLVRSIAEWRRLASEMSTMYDLRALARYT